MNTPKRIYLDHAATSWPKRDSVVRAAFDYTTNCGATAGRGSYSSAIEADRWLSEARRQVAKLIGAADASAIAFTSSGTHSLNAALVGILNPGDHVLTTMTEHNSVLRPLNHLQHSGQVQVDNVRCDSNGRVDLDQAEKLIRSNTKAIVLNHASNVTGVVQNVAAWSELARRTDTILLLDASQTLGYLPIHVQHLGVDLLASAAHKGLGALAGTGLLYASHKLQALMKPLMTGGTGLRSELVDAPLNWPQVVEVGNYNMPGIVSIAVAAKELVEQSEASSSSAVANVAWQNQWRQLMIRLLDGLGRIDGVELIGRSNAVADGPSDAASTMTKPDYVPLVSLRLRGWSPQDLAAVLDSSFGIEVRAGFHCAALIHDAIGSSSDGGTLRISLGHSTTELEVDKLLAALREIAAQTV